MRQQVEAGVDIVSDGEFSKGRNWAFYVHDRISGIGTREATPEEMKDPLSSAGGGQDMRAFPEFYAEYNRASGLGTPARQALRRQRPPHLRRHHREARHRHAEGRRRQGQRARPPSCRWSRRRARCPARKNEHYADEKALLFALADCLHQEYQAIVDAGLYVQIDDAFLPYMHERMVPPMSEAQYRAWAQLRIDALNHALRGIPEERSRYHICWGSWNGPHAFDVPLKDIADLLLQVKVGAYSVEQANPRHEHEWTVWQNVKLPAGQEAHPRRHQPCHQHRRASGAGGAAAGAARQDRRPRKRHGRHRLRLRAEPVRPARSPEHHVGEAALAIGGRAAGERRTVGQEKRGVAAPPEHAGFFFSELDAGVAVKRPHEPPEEIV